MVVVDVEVVDPGTYRALGIVQHGDDLLVGEAIHARPGAVEFADLAGVECGGLALVHKASAEVWTLPLCPGDAGDPYLTLVLGAVASLAGGLLEAPLRDARSHPVVVVLLRDALPLARIMWATHTLDLAALLATGLGAILQAGAHLQWDEWLTGVECCKVTATEPAVGLPRWRSHSGKMQRGLGSIVVPGIGGMRCRRMSVECLGQTVPGLAGLRQLGAGQVPVGGVMMYCSGSLPR